MKAEPGQTYAQVVDGKVHWIFTDKELPEWNPEHMLAIPVAAGSVSIGSIYEDGQFNPTVPWTHDAVLYHDSKIQRMKRDEVLAASDWTQLADVPEATRNKWKPYRQALRDITAQPGFPYDIAWPLQPT